MEELYTLFDKARMLPAVCLRVVPNKTAGLLNAVARIIHTNFVATGL